MQQGWRPEGEVEVKKLMDTEPNIDDSKDDLVDFEPFDCTIYEYEQVNKNSLTITCHVASLKVPGQVACNRVSIKDCRPADIDDLSGNWCLNCLRCRPDFMPSHQSPDTAARPKVPAARPSASSST